jgi:transposase-like protein
MTPIAQNNPPVEPGQVDFQELLRDQLREAIRFTLVTILQAEVDDLVGALPYQRSPGRRDYRNGSYARGLVTGLGPVTLDVPRTRRGFQTQVFERYHRRRIELDQAIGETFVAGASTAQVGGIIETLTGVKPSPPTVSRVHQTLAAEFQAWKTRSLLAHYLYLYADGTYFTVIYNAEGQKTPVLAVVGITPTGERDVLALSVGERENHLAWEAVFDDLKHRGLQQADLWITDGNPAMLNALAAKFSATPRQRCLKHKLDNVLAYIPKKQQALVRPELQAIFYQPSREQAEQTLAAVIQKFAALYPSAMECLQRDIDACLTFYAFPEGHWRTIRTTNVIERLFEEVKKRSHKMSAAFRNEDSCLLLFYAVIRSLKLRRITVTPK